MLLRTPAAHRIDRLIHAAGETLHAPHLIDVEVVHVLRRYVASAAISAQRGLEAVTDLMDFPIRRYSHTMFLARVWELRHRLTAYDAAYLALAEALDAPLLTRDRALAKADSWARIEVV